MRTANVQASLRIRAVSPEPVLFAQRVSAFAQVSPEPVLFAQRVCAFAQSRQNLCCSLTKEIGQGAISVRELYMWPR